MFAIYRNEGTKDEDGYYQVDTTEWVVKDGETPEQLADSAFKLIIEALKKQFPNADLEDRTQIGTQYAPKAVPYLEGQAPQDTIRTPEILSGSHPYFVMRGVTLATSRQAGKSVATVAAKMLGIKKHKETKPYYPIPPDVYAFSLEKAQEEQMFLGSDLNNKYRLIRGPGGVLSTILSQRAA